MLIFRSIKFLGMLVLVMGFLVSSYFLSWIFFEPDKLCLKRSQLISFFSALGIKLLNVKIELIGEIEKYKNRLYVCNHMSYLDILILSSKYSSAYVTSLEMKNTAVLGWITQLAGCLFVDRQNKINIAKEIEEITDALENNINVTIFPEATSSNGEAILRFRKPLYNAAVMADKEVQALCLNYKKIDGEDFNIFNRDKVCWYGDMEFAGHLWNLCGLNQIQVELKVLDRLDVKVYSDCSQLASKSQELIEENFQSCLHARSTSTWRMKWGIESELLAQR